MSVRNKHVLMVTDLFPSEEKPYYCVFLRQLFDSLEHLGNKVSILMPDASLPDGEIVHSSRVGFDVVQVGQTGSLFSSIAGRSSKGFLMSVEHVLGNILPDVIDIHFGATSVCKAVIIAAKKRRIPTIMHYHGLNVFRDFYVAHPILERILERHKVWIADNSDGIVGVSEKIRQILGTKSSNKKIYTVYNGVDTMHFFPANGKNNAIFTIICVANLIPIKGHEYLLHAVHQVCHVHGQPLKVRIIGCGPEKTRLESLTRELGLENTVEFLGARNYDVVAQEMREADFFVMPSYFEALGCVYLEAMASGVAVLGVNNCGIDELIVDKENGYLVDPQNVEQITDRILYAIENPEQHARIAQSGCKTVHEGFLWSHAAAALDRVYNELILGG